MPMSIIIFVIALTFSARYEASAADAERNDFAQIAEMYSASDCGLAALTVRYAAAATAPVAITAICEAIDRREFDGMVTPPAWGLATSMWRLKKTLQLWRAR